MDETFPATSLPADDDLTPHYVSRRQDENAAAAGLPTEVWLSTVAGQPEELRPDAGAGGTPKGTYGPSPEGQPAGTTQGAPQATPGPQAPAEPPREKNPLEKLGMQGSSTAFSDLVERFFPEVLSKERTFVGDAVRGLAKGADLLMATPMKGLANIGMLYLAPLTNTLRAAGVDEGKIEAFHQLVYPIVETAAGFAAPFGAAVGPFSRASTLAAELAPVRAVAQRVDQAAPGAVVDAIEAVGAGGGALPGSYGQEVASALSRLGGFVRQLREGAVRVLRDETGAVKFQYTRGEVTEGLAKNSEVFNDLATVGAAVMYRGANTLAKFQSAMKAEFGDAVLPYIPDVFRASQKKLATTMAIAAERSTAGMPNVKQLTKMFHEGEFGAEWYDKAFGDILAVFKHEPDARLFVDVLASTSPNTEVLSNITMAMRAYDQIKRGMPIVEGAGQGGAKGWMKAHADNLKIAEAHYNAGGYRAGPAAIKGPKVGPFALAIHGDPNAVVVDTWMMRAFGLGDKALGTELTAGHGYITFITKVIRDEAAALGVTPRQYQAAVWVAKKLRDEGAETYVAPLHEALKNRLAAGGQKLPTIKGLLSQEGTAELGTMLTLARLVVGASVGMAQGDTLEGRLRNGVLYSFGAAAASPRLIKALAKSAAEMQPILRGEAGVVYTGAAGRAAKNLVRVIEATPAERDAFLKANPSAIQLGDKTLAINWAALGDPQAIEDTLAKLVSVRGGAIDAARRGVITTQRRKELAALLGTTEDDLMKRPTGQAWNAEKIQAAIDLIGGMARHLDEVNARVQTAAPGTPAATAAEAELSQYLGSAFKMVEAFYGVRAEAGRALQVFQGAAGTTTDAARIGRAAQLAQAGIDPAVVSQAFNPQTPQGEAAIQRVVELAEKGLIANPRKVSDYLATLTEPGERMAFLKNLVVNGVKAQTTRGALGKAADIFTESYINALLFTFQGQAANLVANVATTVLAPWERFVAAGVSSTFRSSEADRVFAGEGLAMVQGAIFGFMDALHAGGAALRSGKSAFGTTKELPARALSSEALGLQGAAGRAADFLGTLVTLPGRTLMSVDEASKVINYRMELWAQATREMRRQGLKGQPARDFVKRFVDTPPDTVKQIAEEFAHYQTFTQDLGPTMAHAQAALSHPVARTVVPFFRTPVNILKYNIERLPGFGAIVPTVRADLQAGGARRDLALAKMSTGAMALGAASYLAMQGKITGRGPADPGLRKSWDASGKKPYSIQIGGQWISYDRLDTVGALFGAVADFNQARHDLGETEAEEYAAAVGVAVSNMVVSRTYLSGLSQALDAITMQDAGKAPKTFWRNYVGTLPGGVPIAGQLAVAPATNQVRQLFDPTVKAINCLSDRMMARIPGYSEGIPAERNLLGETIEVRPGIPAILTLVSPVKGSKAPDPVSKRIFDELVEHRVSVDHPSRVLFGRRPAGLGTPRADEGVVLDAQQYDTLKRVTGEAVKAQLTAILDDPDYAEGSSGPDGMRAFLLRKGLLAAQREGRAVFFEHYPELLDSLESVKTKKAEALTRGRAVPTFGGMR